MRLHDAIVLITGANRGIGLAFAEVALARGARKVYAGARNPASISTPGLIPVKLDVTSDQDVAAAARTCSDVTLVINNAGIGMRTVSPKFLTDPKLFWEIPAQGFRDLIDTNLTGYFLVAKEVVPHFLKAGRGRIINISMNHETMRRRGFIPYGPSRAATESLSHIMAQDLGSSGVTVNLLLPGGATATGMIPDEAPASMRPQILSPDVMAEPVVFLCSDEAHGVNDQRVVAKEFARWKEERTTSGRWIVDGPDE